MTSDTPADYHAKLERFLEDFTNHRHDTRNFAQRFDIFESKAAIAHHEIHEMHSIAMVAQGLFQSFGGIRQDIADIRSSLLSKATDRSGIPASIVMQMFLLYTIAIAVPVWLLVVIGTNTALNVSRDGVAITAEEPKGEGL